MKVQTVMVRFTLPNNMKDIILDEELKKLKYVNDKEINVLKKLNERNELLIVLLQERLHSLLSEYLNTPFVLSHIRSRQLSSLNHFICKNYLPDRLITIKELPTIIMEGYKFFVSILLDNNIDTTRHTTDINIIEKQYYLGRKKILRIIDYCKHNFKPYILEMFIHGSCSDLKLTGFSDIDTFVIIKNEIVFNTEKLFKFKKVWQSSLKYIYKFDSLQHHTHMFAIENELMFYPYHRLPPQIVKTSKAIIGTHTLVFNAYKYQELIFRSFLQLSQRFRSNKIQFKTYNEFTLKNDISVMNLFPALYLQSLNYDINKEEAFIHNKVIRHDTNGIFTLLSKVRLEWETSLLSKVILSIYYNYFIRVFYLKFIIIKIGNSLLTEDSKFKENILFDFNRVINGMSDEIVDALS